MNPIRIVRHLAYALAGLATLVVASMVAAPAAFADYIPPPGKAYQYLGRQPTPPPVHTVHAATAVGMPGWQIALIAAGAALAAAVLAVLIDRVWAARQHVTSPSTQ
jgi:Flp pilus assembly protein CpaB